MKTIVFDLDDTLYDVSLPYFKSLESEGIYIDDKMKKDLFILSRHYSDVYYDKEKAGEIDNKGMYVGRVKHALSDFGIEVDEDKAYAIHLNYLYQQKSIYLSNEMKNLLSFLKERAKLAIITNGPSEHQWGKINQLKLCDYFDKDKIIVSDDVCCRKPDEKIFKIIAQRCDSSLKDCYFVGDSYNCDILGSKSANMKSIWYNHRDRLEENNISDYTVTSFSQLDSLLRKLAECVICD
ncbi:MAG: HAD family hydrolase [Erysipelotrichaceae bacterium]|nr:HAD family hydrolase [Erysipelotrichaceae bacterium]